tara:strand:- start:205 stop:978 length:774 start_codon:yes stop_codon:yes gene_type:complete
LNNFYFYLSKLLAPLFNPTNLIIIIIFLLFFIYYRSKKRIILFVLKVFIVLLILISFLPIGNLGLKYLESEFINQKEIEKIKNIIVLAGPEDLYGTKITGKINLYGSSERLIISITLANNFKNSEIFYVGGNGYIIKSDLSSIPVAKKFYQDLNFDLNKITFIGNTRNTIENFHEIKKLELKDKESVLITSAYHMKRSLIIASKKGLNLIPYAVDFQSVSKKSFLNSYQKFSVTSNLAKFNLFFREIVGIVAFKIFY